MAGCIEEEDGWRLRPPYRQAMRDITRYGVALSGGGFHAVRHAAWRDGDLARGETLPARVTIRTGDAVLPAARIDAWVVADPYVAVRPEVGVAPGRSAARLWRTRQYEAGLAAVSCQYADEPRRSNARVGQRRRDSVAVPLVAIGCGAGRAAAATAVPLMAALLDIGRSGVAAIATNTAAARWPLFYQAFVAGRSDDRRDGKGRRRRQDRTTDVVTARWAVVEWR
ncbi:MAG: hypothetical protein U1A27_05480 [Phycisphaerae bacterium]